MIRLLSIPAALALLTVPALAASADYTVDPFTEIAVSNGVIAKIAAGVGPQHVGAKAGSQDALDRLKVDVVDGQLRIGLEDGFLGFDIFGNNIVTVTVQIPALDLVSGSTGASVDVHAAGTRPLRIEAWLGANLTVAGSCGTATVLASQGANLDASALLCSTVNVEADTGANAKVYAGATAKVTASVGATVGVYGNPVNLDADDDIGANIFRVNN